MSCHCRVANTAMLVKAMQLLCIGKDPWAALMFTPSHLVVHLGSPDQCLTATATLGKNLFSEFVVGGTPQFIVSVPALIDALTLCASPSQIALYSRAILTYPDSDGKLVVEVSEGTRTARSTLSTRAIGDHLLDLRFRDSASFPNRVCLRSDAAREVVSDLVAFQSDRVQLTFASRSVAFCGFGSPFGDVKIEVDRGSESVSAFECHDNAIQPRYLVTHLAQAFGTGPSVKHSSGPQYGSGSTMLTALPPDSSSSGFDRTLVEVNAERQLCVTHQAYDNVVAVVKVTVAPLSSLLDV